MVRSSCKKSSYSAISREFTDNTLFVLMCKKAPCLSAENIVLFSIKFDTTTVKRWFIYSTLIIIPNSSKKLQ